jgi:tetratricopeptide (TPR) repeat protein
MLFDLRSPGRRRVIKVIYGGLAFLMASGLIFFGIGSDATGGLSEIFGGGGGGDTGFEDQIEDAEKAVEENPRDTAALTELVQLHYQAGTSRIEIDPDTQQQTLTAEAEEELQASADAWDSYVKFSKGKVSSSTALLAVQAFATLAQGQLAAAAGGADQQALDDADDSLASWKGAAEAQRVAAEERGDADSYASLATLLYFAGEFDQADQATQQALAAAKGDETSQLEKELSDAEKQGRQINTAIEQYRKQLEKAGAATGENPLSGLGGGGLSGGGAGGGLSGP